MPYNEIEYSQITHQKLNKVLSHINVLFKDLYGVFKLPTDKTSGEGEGNFSITLVLLCIIDGISANIYPTKAIKDQEKRFKMLIRDKLYWGSTKDGWLDKGKAAKQLYLEIRNPLVHELGADKITSAREPGHREPRIGKWGSIEKSHHNIDLIDGLQQWNDNWPTLTVVSDAKGDYIKFSAAALYWSVKKMAINLINDKNITQNAMIYLDGNNEENREGGFF